MDTPMLTHLWIVIAIVRCIIALPGKSNGKRNRKNMKIGKIVSQCIQWHDKGNVRPVSLTNISRWKRVRINPSYRLIKVYGTDLCLKRMEKTKDDSRKYVFHVEVVSFIESRNKHTKLQIKLVSESNLNGYSRCVWDIMPVDQVRSIRGRESGHR